MLAAVIHALLLGTQTLKPATIGRLLSIIATTPGSWVSAMAAWASAIRAAASIRGAFAGNSRFGFLVVRNLKKS